VKRLAGTHSGTVSVGSPPENLGFLASRRVLQFLGLAAALLCLAMAGAPAASAADPVIAAAGDIACSPSDGDFNSGNGTATRCRQKYTSNLLVNAGLATVLTLGDNQYNSGSLSNFQASYDPSWGRVKSITRPSAGNHEPHPSTGYFDYFNGVGNQTGPAGARGKGYYSFDVGPWHLIALNSNCPGGCEAGSAQEQWLRADLAANPTTCTLAYWHHPRFSSGHDKNNLFMQPIWQALYDAGADVALVGHSHDYERFAPQDESGNLDRTNGIREFVVGTGGAFWTGLSTAQPNSEVRQNNTYGVLKLTLHPTSYDWQFVPEAGKTFTDSGSQSCSGAPPPPADSESPSAPTNLTATVPNSIRVDLSWGASTDNVGVTGYEVFRDGVLIASPSGTNYTDNTVTGGNTYVYKVRALDAAGNRSGFSNSKSVTTPGSTVRLAPTADARVEEANPTVNYGTAFLRTDGGSGADVESYLSFDVPGEIGPVESAKLRIYAYSDTTNGPAAYSTSNSWTEAGITWSNRPARTSVATDDKGAIPANSWVEWEVGSLITTNGRPYSFTLGQTSSNGTDFRSREYTDVSLRPELVLSAGNPSADLLVTKAGPGGPVIAGQALTYTVTVGNQGPSDAQSVSLSDTLPPDLTGAQYCLGSGCTDFSSSWPGSLSLGTVGADQSQVVRIRATVKPNTTNGTTLLNAASASTSTPDPDNGNNTGQHGTTVDTEADLRVTKSGNPDPVTAGQMVTYTVTARNVGLSDARDVSLSDTLPAELTGAQYCLGSGCTDFSSAWTGSLALGTLTPDQSQVVRIRATVRSNTAGGTSLHNEATGTSSTSDPDAANNTGQSDLSVNRMADLSLSKSDSPDPVLAGHPVTYTLTAQNSGPSNAGGVRVTDNLPSGATFDSATASQGTCAEATGTVTCNLGSLASDVSATVEIRIVPQGEGTLANSASIQSDESDPNNANDSASESTTVNPAAGLSLTKTDSPDPVVQTQVLTYTLTARNHGPSGATGVRVTDNLPSGVSFQSASASQGSCSEASGTVTCNLGSLARNTNATVTIEVRPETTGPITNSASVVGDQTDPTPSDNSASEPTTIDPAADVSLTKSDSPDPVVQTQVLTYTLTARNNGPSAATGVRVTDSLPAGASFDSAAASQGTCAEATGTVTCNLGSLASEATATATIKVRPQTEGTITNSASVQANQTDLDTNNNNASAATTVDPAADLSLTKSDSPDPVLAGQTLAYTLTARNHGPSTATGVTVVDNLPAGADFESATSNQGFCTRSLATVTCNVGDLASDATVIVTIRVRPQAEGAITNTASAQASETDPDTNNNGASESTTVTAAADLSLTKSDSPDPALRGQLLTYTLTARNNGPGSATGVTVTDNPPAGVSFDSASTSQGICTEAAGTVSCDLGSLVSDATATVTIEVRAEAEGTITNSASVQGNESDPNTNNNNASESTTVFAAADLSLTKSDSPDPVTVGRTLTYTLMATNGGPSAATGVSVTDDLPATAIYESATPSQGFCSHSLLGTVSCSLGTLSSGESATVSITVRPQGEGTIDNTASTTANETDPDTTNNTAQESTTVEAPLAADLSITKSDSPDPVAAGDILTYNLTATNSGPSSASSVNVSDDLPLTATYESATASQGSCTQERGTVSCSLGTLSSVESATVEIKVRPQAEGTITNSASVQSSETDPNGTNNNATESTTINPGADLSLTKSDSPDPVLTGQALTYTLTARNNGPSSATGVTVTDALPAGASFGSATPSQGSCSTAGGTVSCELGTLANDARAAVEIKIKSQSEGTIANTASAAGAEGDPDSANNTATEPTTVTLAPGQPNCTKFASPDGSDADSGDTATTPYRTAQYLVDNLTSGGVGCLVRPAGRTGVFDESVEIRTSGITLTSATPIQGEFATLKGRLQVTASKVTVSKLILDGRNSGGYASPTINANNVTFTDNNVTSLRTVDCFTLANRATSSYLIRNRIHDCKDGVVFQQSYFSGARDNLIYDNQGVGIKFYPDADYTSVFGAIVDGNDQGVVFGAASTPWTTPMGAAVDNVPYMARVTASLVTNSTSWNITSVNGQANIPLWYATFGCVWPNDDGFGKVGDDGGNRPPLGVFRGSYLGNADPGYRDRAAKDFHTADTGCRNYTTSFSRLPRSERPDIYSRVQAGMGPETAGSP
jgi:uncharacterized repeat protein (TIGR01451 family)